MFGAALEDFSRASAIRQIMVSKVNHLNWPTPKESILKGDVHGGTPKSSILMVFSIINRPFGGTPNLRYQLAEALSARGARSA